VISRTGEDTLLIKFRNPVLIFLVETRLAASPAAKGDGASPVSTGKS